MGKTGQLRQRGFVSTIKSSRNSISLHAKHWSITRLTGSAEFDADLRVPAAESNRPHGNNQGQRPAMHLLRFRVIGVLLMGLSMAGSALAQLPVPKEQPIDLASALQLGGVDNPEIRLARERVREAVAYRQL